MLNRLLGLLLFAAILGVLALNFKQILTFSQAQVTHNAARKAIEAQNWEKAIEIYEDAAKLNSSNTTIALELGWLYQQDHQPDAAEGVYRGILRTEPANRDARIGLAEVLRTNPQRINDAIDELRNALKDHPKDPLLLMHIGNLYKDAANNPAESRHSVRKWLYDQARYYYELSLRLDPTQFQPNFNLGVAYQHMENLEPSAKAYCKALILRPDSFEARYNLGLVLSQLNYLDESYRQLDRAVKTLADANRMDEAQSLAQKVQNIKSGVYNSSKQGLAGKEIPPFLDSNCLVMHE